MTDDVCCTCRPDLVKHQGLSGHGNHDSARVAQAPGCTNGRQSGVSSGRGVEVDSAAYVCWVAKMREDLIAHSTGLEGAAGLHILQLQEDPTSSCPRKARRLDQGCLDPWRFELQLIAGGDVDAAHFDVLNKWKGKKKDVFAVHRSSKIRSI
mgnify:FL=1